MGKTSSHLRRSYSPQGQHWRRGWQWTNIGLDEDDPTAFEGIELPTTTTWETRPGRLGMRFTCKDRTPELLAKYGKKADQAQLKLYREGKPVGEVKLERTYQVIPPSWKILEDGKRADYKMLQETPPAEISLEKLLSDLEALGITFSEKPNVARASAPVIISPLLIEDNGTEGGLIDKKKYARKAFISEMDILRNTEEGDRDNQLNKSAFNLAQLVAAGLLDEKEMVDALCAVAESTGLSEREARATIESAFKSGIAKPRKVPDANNDNPANEMSPEDRLKGLKEALELVKALEKEKVRANIPKLEAEIKALEEEINNPPPSEKAIKVGNNILRRGKVLKFLVQQAQRNHKGDEGVIKILIASIASTASAKSKGFSQR